MIMLGSVAMSFIELHRRNLRHRKQKSIQRRKLLSENSSVNPESVCTNGLAHGGGVPTGTGGSEGLVLGNGGSSSGGGGFGNDSGSNGPSSHSRDAMVPSYSGMGVFDGNVSELDRKPSFEDLHDEDVSDVT